MSDEKMGALAKALAAAQAEMQNAVFNRVNPHFRSKYADLAGIRDTVTPALAKHGLAVSQLVTVSEAGPVLRTCLIHTGGGMLESVYPLPQVADPQKFGSALTYSRRYSLAAICNIASEEDDDGEAATAPTRQPPQRTESRPETAAERAMTQEEKAAKWAQDAVAKIRACQDMAALDAWEGKHADALDRLMDADRPSWEVLKRRLHEARQRLMQDAA